MRFRSGELNLFGKLSSSSLWSHGGTNFRPSAVRGRADIDFRRYSGLFPITLCNSLPERFCLAGLDQINRAATETPARHAAAVITGQACRRFHHNVQLAATDFVQISQAAVRLSHQLTGGVQVPGLKTAHGIKNALVLLDDVQP